MPPLPLLCRPPPRPSPTPRPPVGAGQGAHPAGRAAARSQRIRRPLPILAASTCRHAGMQAALLAALHRRRHKCHRAGHRHRRSLWQQPGPGRRRRQRRQLRGLRHRRGAPPPPPLLLLAGCLLHTLRAGGQAADSTRPALFQDARRPLPEGPSLRPCHHTAPTPASTLQAVAKAVSTGTGTTIDPKQLAQVGPASSALRGLAAPPCRRRAERRGQAGSRTCGLAALPLPGCWRAHPRPPRPIPPCTAPQGNAGAVSNAISQGVGCEWPALPAGLGLVQLLACRGAGLGWAGLGPAAGLLGAGRQPPIPACTHHRPALPKRSQALTAHTPNRPPAPAACSSKASSTAGGFSQQSTAVSTAVADAVARVCGAPRAPAALLAPAWDRPLRCARLLACPPAHWLAGWACLPPLCPASAAAPEMARSDGLVCSHARPAAHRWGRRKG